MPQNHFSGGFVSSEKMEKDGWKDEIGRWKVRIGRGKLVGIGSRKQSKVYCV